jgi:hypothetical protein
VGCGVGGPPPPRVGWGGGGGRGGTLACGRGIGRVPIPTRGHKLRYSMFVCTLCNQIVSPCHILAIDGKNLIAGHEFVHTRTTGRHKSRTRTFKKSVQRADFRPLGTAAWSSLLPFDGAATRFCFAYFISLYHS